MAKRCRNPKTVSGKYDPVGGFYRFIKRSYYSYILCQKGKLGLILRLKCCTFSVTGWISGKYKINDEITEINGKGKNGNRKCKNAGIR